MKRNAKSMGKPAQEHAKMQSGKGDMKGMPGMPGMPAMEGAKREGEEQPSEFTVPVARQQQIGVTYATIQKQPFTHTVRAVGMVAYDKQRHWDYVTRVEGYVKNLSVFSRGELVWKDAPILTFYSTILITTLRELVNRQPMWI